MKKILTLLLAFSMIATMAVGCTPKEPTTPVTPPGGDAPTTPPTSTAAPDNDLVIGFNVDVQSLDPQQASDTLSLSVLKSMYEPLLMFNEKQEMVPNLATKWEIGKDNLTYTFTLREDVKFHDGEAFNSAAFKANYDRCMADTKLRQYNTVNKWESVETPDAKTVVIKLKAPNSSFLNKMTMFYMISPKSIAAGKDVIVKTPVGTGAYTFKERMEGSHVIVVPNANYWNGVPTVKSITFKAIPEDGSRVAMLQTGEADYIYPLPTTQVATVEGKNNVIVNKAPSAIMRYVTLNTNLPELKDKKVRQAMNYAIDKNAYIKTVFNGFATEVKSVYPSTVQYYSGQTAYDFNLEKAKTLLKEAGYEKGFKLTLWGDNTTNEIKGMQFVAQQLAQIGIEVEVLPAEPNTLGDMIYVEPKDAKINMWYVNWSPSSFDADGAMRNILTYAKIPPTSANTAYYNNPAFDGAMDKALEITDAAELAKLYAEAQALAWEDCPWLFLGSDQVISGQKGYVSGIHLGPDGGLNVTKAKLS